MTVSSKSKKLQLTLPEYYYDFLESWSSDSGISKSNLILMLLKEVEEKKSDKGNDKSERSY